MQSLRFEQVFEHGDSRVGIASPGHSGHGTRYLKYLDFERLIDFPNSISDPPLPTTNVRNAVSMQNFHGDNFVGNKTQYNNTGSGPMINGASGPISFGGT
jgi:hypothetical protein